MFNVHSSISIFGGDLSGTVPLMICLYFVPVLQFAIALLLAERCNLHCNIRLLSMSSVCLSSVSCDASVL